MWGFAAKLRVVLLRSVLRYYGDSQPFAVASGKLPTQQYAWLTIEQVIEDTAAVLRHVRAKYLTPAALPAIVIGGELENCL